MLLHIGRLHLLFFILFSSSVSAAIEASPLLADIASEPQWLKLIHYEPDSSSPSGWRSAIHSQEFFLSPAGGTDPLAELTATLAAFDLPHGSDVDLHAQCLFPARLQWLKSRLVAYSPAVGEVKCSAFESWTRGGNVESLSIVFATGFLGNPASYYGHTLLKFNFRGDTARGGLMDVSVNYGAILDGSDDSLPTYLVKSLFGGYDAGFSHIHFYFHNHNYGDHELRDLWEYELELPKKAVDLVVAHAWEVMGKRYTYYFFRSNCAYRMAELVQIVDGVQFIPESRPWVIPQALVQNMVSAHYRGRPLVARTIYHPSRQSRYYEKFANLSVREQGAFKLVANQKDYLYTASFKDEPLESKQAILDTLIDYYQFAANPLSEASPALRKQYADVLAARYRLPAGARNLNPRPPESPDHGRTPGWVQVLYGHSSVTGDMTSVRVRPAYYDPLDGGSGHVTNGALSMGDAQIDVRHGHVRLNRIDAIKIESVNPGVSGLPGDNGKAWKLKVGVEQQDMSCNDCLVARAQADIGLGRQWSPGLFGAIYMGGGLQNAHADQGAIFFRPSAALIYKPFDNVGTRISYEHRFYMGARSANYGALQSEARWAFRREFDLRVSYEHDKAGLFAMGLGMYW